METAFPGSQLRQPQGGFELIRVSDLQAGIHSYIVPLEVFGAVRLDGLGSTAQIPLI
ncbi:MAG: hypothetical protein JNL98_22910 [Bryobacterales bacterium]|nr:hypothetical protein [Bryobacterales bacterium]